ncbi:hypothetical protein RvY_15392 [Ramazzottius varieornatus]|uniref:2Fe-2S ferredoxin-type domain-containing protein n=1 Tax=Ramazzottius varieornatus TaxID=947166 RepID=A0A1D1VWC5_RAMVA|nr:hypothetical protein RvY_15392 [Ramazzottius varieornatus]
MFRLMRSVNTAIRWLSTDELLSVQSSHLVQRVSFADPGTTVVRSVVSVASAAPTVAGANDLKVKFLRDGKEYMAYGKKGDTLLDMIINNELDFDGFGACEGTLACSTCHVVLKKDVFDKLPNKACDEELDMLDLAYGLTDTSRLGCQIEMTEELDGIEVEVPASTFDAR